MSDECLALCDSQLGCKAITFDTTGCLNNCYLFSSLDGLTTTPNPTSDSSVYACGALSGPETAICGTVLTGVSDSRNYQVQCGITYAGSSSLSTITAASYNECFDNCDANPYCSAFTFDSSVCSDNCKLLAYSDDLSMTSSSTSNSGFTPGKARDYTCAGAICGTAVDGGGRIGDQYLVACRCVTYSILTRLGCEC